MTDIAEVAADTASKSETLLSIQNLTVRYGASHDAVVAVRNVSLDLARGEVFGLAGESGCGKSTLGLSILRLLPSIAKIDGKIMFGGDNLLTARWAELRAVRWADISMVFQGAMSALNPVKTIGEQMMEPILLHDKVPRSQAHHRAGELLDQVGIGARRMASYPHELSGGQRQRVMIAMALACRPDLIIADEPTTALDVMVQAQVLDLLTSLVRAEGISVILISHDLSVLSRTCDRAGVMYAGELVEVAPARQLFTSPKHPYSRALARAFPEVGDPDARMNPSGLPGDALSFHDGLVGCPFAPRCEFAIEACRTIAPRLHPVGVDTRAACLRLEDGYPSLPGADSERTGVADAGAEDRIGESVLAARGVELVYPARGKNPPAVAVDGVDLEIHKGEILALIGESGCGKSTLARTLVGLVKPTAGHVEYRGAPLQYKSASLRAFRRGVQLVLQDPLAALNPRQKVHEAVAEGLRLHHEKKQVEERVHDAMDRAGLHPAEFYEERYPHELSGGQLQRVVIAGALVLNPDILVADEPVSALDASARGEILSLFLELRDSLGLAALVVSHDLALAWNVADRVAVMYLGRIVELGEAPNVLLNPEHPYTQALLSVIQTDEARGGKPAQVLKGEGPDPTHIAAGCRFHPRCPIYAMLPEGDPRRERCRTEDPTLHAADSGAQVACHFPTTERRGPEWENVAASGDMGETA